VAVIASWQFWLWRAVDDEGEVLDLPGQRGRDKAVKLMRKLLKKQGFALDVRWSPTSCGLTARQSPKSDCRVGMSKVAEEQSSREFTSTGTTRRGEDATLQIARISPALPVDSRRGLHQRPASSHILRHAPRRKRRSVADMGSRYRCLSPRRDLHIAHGQLECV
jgi:hypothetical protein